MANNPITVPLPADLPENWSYGQTVAPNGSEAGLSEQYGYNYLMEQVNAAQQAATEIGEAFSGLAELSGGKIPVSQLPAGVPDGVATLDSTGKVPASQLPSMDYIPTSEKGAASGVATLDTTTKVPIAQLPAGTANGVATLDSTGKVPASQLPSMDYIPNSQKGVASGVATLDESGDLVQPVPAASVQAGTFPGIVAANANTSYTTPQVRSIILSTEEPTGGNNGDLWFTYTPA